MDNRDKSAKKIFNSKSNAVIGPPQDTTKLLYGDGFYWSKYDKYYRINDDSYWEQKVFNKEWELKTNQDGIDILNKVFQKYIKNQTSLKKPIN